MTKHNEDAQPILGRTYMNRSQLYNIKYIKFHVIYEYMTLTIYKMYINYATMHPLHLKKGIIIPMVSY